MSYNLFLDDQRQPEDVFYYIPDPRYHTLTWVVVRSYAEFTTYIQAQGLPALISFDHDLADLHYGSAINGVINYDDYTEKTGYDCAQWLGTYCATNHQKLPPYLVHSMNNIGRQNIESYLKNYRKHVEQCSG